MQVYGDLTNCITALWSTMLTYGSLGMCNIQ
nr:MAG TPA: hypothetical protein [Caudoviricetes sp.]DAT66592.1 MAG TPA: hypothetical protein [Caudoviricetes sp.]